jgi:cytochrome P450
VSTAGAYHQTPAAAAPPPAGCPVHHAWSPLNEDYLADPYPIASELREDLPIFYAESLGYVVVNRMADIEAVFTDHETYASTNVQDPVFPLSPEAAAVLAAPDFNPVAVMSNRPEPDHGRIRVYTRQGFSNRRLKTLEPYIRTRAGELIDQMVAAGSPAEYVQALAFPLPGETVFRFLGFPEADDERLKSWCQDRKAFSWGNPTATEQAAIAEKMLAYWRYCREFVASKATNPGDDFTSELIAAHQADETELSYREVESVVYGLSFAGHEAVTALLCNTLLCLLPRRDQWDELVADAALDSPTLINNAIEEVVRFESSQVSWRRVTTKPVTLGGYDLPVGTKVFMNFAAANRQPDIFDDPHTFDIHRKNAGHNISFGKGVHFCLGASLARLEARVVLEELLTRVPTLRLVPDQEIAHFPNITFRGPERLQVEWS